MASRSTSPKGGARRRRIDAERSIAAILGAAIEVLNDRPQATVEQIAAAAGVTRQTVYAHFASRDALLEAVVARVIGDVNAALDAAELEHRAPAAALQRLLDVSFEIAARHQFMFHLPTVGQERDIERHGPITTALERLVKRGQTDGSFDPHTPPSWLIAATFALGNAANEAVRAGHISSAEATIALHRSILRLFGVQDAQGQT
jgi:AcrR family transcriptional regulator